MMNHIHRQDIHDFKLLVMMVLLLGTSFCVGIKPLYARSIVVANFDDVQGSPFSYKDDKGTQFKISKSKESAPRNNVLSLDFSIARNGFAGWGTGLNGLDAQNFTILSFQIRGSRGPIQFEVGLKDLKGIEKKLSISQFMDVGTEWKTVKIPLKEFVGVNLSGLDNMSFGFSDAAGQGTLYVDDIQFEASDTNDARTESSANKVVIDGFERSNPTDAYLVFEADDSSLQLNASRIAKEGDYSMELVYTLSSDRPFGTWVTAQWQSKGATLDWRGADTAKLWVKGDGSGNIFKFIIRDSDGERWVYQNTEVLKSTRWEQVVMPFSAFILEDKATKKNGKLDLDQIHSYSFMIQSPGGSNSTPGFKTSEGHVQIDQLYITGEKINPVWAVPQGVAELEKIKLLKAGNINLNGQLFTEFFYDPEQQSRVTHFGKLIVDGKVSNYSGRFEISSQGQEFGDSSYFNLAQSTAGGTTTTNQFPQEIATSIQGFANNISPYLTLATVGNVFVDYSNYTFSPVFGFKGITLEGDYDLINYHTFVLKHKFDSYTAGSRIKSYWHGTRFTGIGVYYRETGITQGGAISNGTIAQPNSQTQNLQEIQNDMVYTLDAEHGFFDDRIIAGGIVGFNRYNLLATVNRSDPFNPVYGNALNNPLDVGGYMERGRLILKNILLPGSQIAYEYRSVDTEFKPYYRQNPANFDDLESDQRGHNIRLIQTRRGFTGTVEYDTLQRASNSDYYRHRVNWNLGYYGFDRTDVAFNQSVRTETYNFISDRTGIQILHNERETDSEIYMRFQINPQLAVILRPLRQDIYQMDSGVVFVNESLYGRLEFFPITNLRVVGEFRTTHFGNKAFEPIGTPFSDNFLRTSIEFDF